MNWTEEIRRELAAADLARAALGAKATPAEVDRRARAISREIRLGRIKMEAK